MFAAVSPGRLPRAYPGPRAVSTPPRFRVGHRGPLKHEPARPESQASGSLRVVALCLLAFCLGVVVG